MSSREFSTNLSILIILMGSLGDVVRGLYLVPHIKRNMPDSKISWLIEPKWAELVDLHPQVDHVIIFNRPKGARAVWDLYRDLAEEHFHITLDLQRHFKSGFFSLLSRGKRRVGFHRRDAKEFNWIFNNETISYFGDELPKLHHYLKFTEYLGLPPPDCLESGFSSLDLKAKTPRSVAELDAPFIAVVMGSSWDSKDWLFEGYYQLVKHVLASRREKIVLLGDRSKSSLAALLTEKVASPSLINLVGKTSLLEVAAVLRAASAGVGPDSGPAHLAPAMGTPYVTIFGPTSPARVSPFGCEHLAVQSEVECAPCYKKQCPGLDRLCMRQITAGTVEEKLSQALAMGTAN